MMLLDRDGKSVASLTWHPAVRRRTLRSFGVVDVMERIDAQVDELTFEPVSTRSPAWSVVPGGDPAVYEVRWGQMVAVTIAWLGVDHPTVRAEAIADYLAADTADDDWPVEALGHAPDQGDPINDHHANRLEVQP